MGEQNKLVFIGVIALALALILANGPYKVNSQGVQIITASPGQTVTYHGTGSPGSDVTIEISASINVGVNKGYYISKMNGVNIPGGSSFSISAQPVTSLAVSGSPTWAGGLGYSIQGSVSGGVGHTSMGNIPAGGYNIVVSGASGSSQVTLSVHASQMQSVDVDGTFTASVSTSGLPATVYLVKQDGLEVAQVYLGVSPPATPTPTAEPTITPSPNATVSPSPNATVSPSPNATVSPSPNATFTPTPDASVSPSPNASVSPTVSPSAKPTASPTTGTWFGFQLPSLDFLWPTTASPTAQPWTPTPSPTDGNTSTPSVTSGPSAFAAGNGSPLSGVDAILIVAIIVVLLSYGVIFMTRKK